MEPSLARKPRWLLGAAAAIVVIVAGVGIAVVLSSGPSTPTTTTSTSPVVPSPTRLFAPTSIWNAPVPANAAVDPSSSPLIQALSTEVTREVHAGIGPWIATDKASTPIYVVSADQPVVRVQLSEPTLWWRVALQRAFEAVPIPSDAQPARGPDEHMTVWQPSTDKLWEFFHMTRESDGWHAAWGGAIDHVSTSPGYYTRSSWPGALPQWGATATSLPVAAGVVTLAEFRSGVIPHALALNLPAPRAGVVALPAQRGDGVGGPDTIPEGAHLRLDPTLDLDSLHLPPVARMLAVAAQRYGLIVRDQTRLGISLFGEDATQYGGKSLYHGPHGIFRGLTPEQILKPFPWSHLKVLKLKLIPVKPSVGHF